MWNPIESYRQRQARNRYMPKARPERTGRIAKVSVIALVLILAISAALELGGGGEASSLAEHVRAEGVPPLELIEQAARARRLVFLADVPGTSAPRRLAAEAIEKLGTGIGLDAVALEVPASEQPYIDLYLNRPEEDAGILLSRPRAVREGEAGYFDIYRAVRRVNDRLPPERRLRIIALDDEDWPPQRALSPNQLAQRFGARDSAMQQRIQGVLDRAPRAKILIFVSGLQALASGGARVQTGGTRTIEATWLAARLRERYPQDVYSILVDAPGAGTARPLVASYRGTVAGPLLAEEGVGSIGVSTRTGFDFSRQPIRVGETPGIRFELEPRAFTLADVAHGYIYLEQ